MSDQSAEKLSAFFRLDGWTPSEQNFQSRSFVIWHGSFYSVAGTPPGGFPTAKACKTDGDVIAFLNSFRGAIQAPLPEPEPEPPEPVIAEPVVSIPEPVEPEPVPEPEAVPEPIQEPEPEPVVAAPEPYVPNFQIIPEPLATFAEADETASEFRRRLKNLWQRFGISDGQNFPGGGEALTGEEKIAMREIDMIIHSEEGRAAHLREWLFAD